MKNVLDNSLVEFSAICREYGMSVSFDNDELSLKEKEHTLSQIVSALNMNTEQAENFTINVLARCPKKKK